MAIQNRRGNFVDFDPYKMLAGEFAYALDTEELYYCIFPGNVKRCATKEDVIEILETNQDAYNKLQELLTELEDGVGIIGILNDISDLVIKSNENENDIASLKTNKADKTYVDTELGKKVDKVTGKELSTNDYTTAEKTKLSGIATGANNYVHPAGTNPHGTTKSDVGLGNVDNVKQMPISGGVLENYREKITTLSGATVAINLSLGNVFTHSITGNTTYSITNAVTGQAHSFTLIISMSSTVRPLTFPSSVKWQGGEKPDMTTANKTYVLTFMTVNGGTNWFGMFGGEF